MHRTKKGKQWDFGLKAHTGVEAKEGVVQSLVTTAATRLFWASGNTDSIHSVDGSRCASKIRAGSPEE